VAAVRREKDQQVCGSAEEGKGPAALARKFDPNVLKPESQLSFSIDPQRL
jgi:hypothetical protein